MDLSDEDIRALVGVFNGILIMPNQKLTGCYFAWEVRAAAAEFEIGRQEIVEMYDAGEIEKNPDDDAAMGAMAEEPYNLADLAERVETLTDADAMAAWVRVQEILRPAR